MPAVGRISINLSLRDVAVGATSGFTRFFTIGFLVAVIIFGFALPVGFDGGVNVLLMIGFLVLLGAGATSFFCTAPVPLRPSITILPSWV